MIYIVSSVAKFSEKKDCVLPKFVALSKERLITLSSLLLRYTRADVYTYLTRTCLIRLARSFNSSYTEKRPDSPGALSTREYNPRQNYPTFGYCQTIADLLDLEEKLQCGLRLYQDTRKPTAVSRFFIFCCHINVTTLCNRILFIWIGGSFFRKSGALSTNPTSKIILHGF